MPAMEISHLSEPAPAFCCACGRALPPEALTCPECQQLVHAAELEGLAQEALVLERAGQMAEAGQCWSRCLALLPAESKQAATLRGHLARISAHEKDQAQEESSAKDDQKSEWFKRFGGFGVVLAVLWKFKVAMLLVLSKLKLLLFGLGKAKTLFSMMASIGFYWTLYGWRFAVGFIGGIYVHEMGHVAALRKLGIRAGAPMFIPGLGAFVSLYESPRDEVEDAQIGLAGPLWGMAFTLAAAAVAWPLESNVGKAIVHASAWINLFNLIPIWQLDGGRGFRALPLFERYQVVGACAALWFVTSQGVFFLIILGALYRMFWVKDHHPVGSSAGTQFVLLLALLGGLAALPAPGRP